MANKQRNLCTCYKIKGCIPTHPQGTADHMEFPGKPRCIGKEDWGMMLMPDWQSNTRPLKNITSKECFKEGRTSMGLESVVSRRSLLLFSRSVTSDSLRPHELQHARLSHPSPSPELAQTHVHWVGDAIQPSHPLSSPFPPALNLSQHQGLFQWVSSSHQVAKVLELQLLQQSF